jgi:hypothetical protein
LGKEKMDGYLELKDNSKFGRAYSVRLFSKFCTSVILIAAFYFLASDKSDTTERVLGGVLLAAGLILGYWSFRPTYRCPKCARQMSLTRRERKESGRDLFLTCDDCKVSIDLKVQEE